MPTRYILEFTPAALRDLKRLPRDVHKIIALALGALADNPRPQGCEKLEGSDITYRIRCGDYRVIYQIHEDILTVAVVRARHRREVYRNISHLLKR